MPHTNAIFPSLLTSTSRFCLPTELLPLHGKRDSPRVWHEQPLRLDVCRIVDNSRVAKIKKENLHIQLHNRKASVRCRSQLPQLISSDIAPGPGPPEHRAPPPPLRSPHKSPGGRGSGPPPPGSAGGPTEPVRAPADRQKRYSSASEEFPFASSADPADDDLREAEHGCSPHMRLSEPGKASREVIVEEPRGCFRCWPACFDAPIRIPWPLEWYERGGVGVSLNRRRGGEAPLQGSSTRSGYSRSSFRLC